MKSFSFGDPGALNYAVNSMNGKYPMELNPHDMTTILTALYTLWEQNSDTDLGENAGSLYSSILSTLGVEVI